MISKNEIGGILRPFIKGSLLYQKNNKILLPNLQNWFEKKNMKTQKCPCYIFYNNQWLKQENQSFSNTANLTSVVHKFPTVTSIEFLIETILSTLNSLVDWWGEYIFSLSLHAYNEWVMSRWKFGCPKQKWSWWM